MPSTEFLLYLVIVIFTVFLIMQYYKEDSYLYGESRRHDFDNRSEQQQMPPQMPAQMPPQMQPQMPMNGQNQMPPGQGQGRCQNPMCRQTGRCNCPKSNIHVNINNEEDGYGYGGMPGMGPGVGPGMGMVDPRAVFDRNAIYDDLTPPFRRSIYDDANPPLPPGLWPSFTRGPSGKFRKIGLLIAEGVAADDKYKFLNLMGRQIYPNGGGYEYYATSTNVENKLKIYIETKEKQIYCGDVVKIPELSGYTYIFKEDVDLSPKYSPYWVY